MIKPNVLILLLLLCSFAWCQDGNRPASAESSPKHCELTQEDYAVFAALLKGLQGPEDPEEAWAGKEILISDMTAVPGEAEKKTTGWGFRSKSKAAPSQETVTDYTGKGQSQCTVQPNFGDPPYKIIAQSEIDHFFSKVGDDGWKKFYEEFPKSAGFWRLSRPGYNSAGNEALLYVSHVCGYLCGTGHLYLLSKEEGKWIVKNRLMLWIS
jgi:hypothetical protein